MRIANKYSRIQISSDVIQTVNKKHYMLRYTINNFLIHCISLYKFIFGSIAKQVVPRHHDSDAER